MSETLERVRRLVTQGRFEVSRHGYRRLSEHDILATEAVTGVLQAIVVEDALDYHLGSRAGFAARWVRTRDSPSLGNPRGVVTAYRPDLTKWLPDFLNRRS